MPPAARRESGYIEYMQVLLMAAWLAVGAQAQEAPIQPAYQAVERVSDGVYKLLRHYVAGTLLPDRLTRHLSDAPDAHTYGLFSAELAKKQGQAAARLKDSYPAAKHGLRDREEMAEWQRRFEREETQVGIDSLKNALVERYELESFGRFSELYSKDRRNWDPQFLASSAVLGGTYVWFAGFKKTFRYAGLEAAVGAKPQRRSASLEVGVKDAPLKLKGEVGQFATRYGVSFAQRF